MISLAAATGALANWTSVLLSYVLIPLALGFLVLRVVGRLRKWVDQPAPTMDGLVYERLSQWLPRTGDWVIKVSTLTLALLTLWVGIQMTSPLRSQAERLRAFSKALTTGEAGSVIGLEKNWKCHQAPLPRKPKELLTFLFLGVQRYPITNSDGRSIHVLLPSGLTTEEVNAMLNQERVYRSTMDRRALVAAPALKAIQSNLGRYPDFASVLIWIAWLLLLPGMFCVGAFAILLLQVPAALWDRHQRFLLCHAFHRRVPLEFHRVQVERGKVKWGAIRYRANLFVPLEQGYLTDTTSYLHPLLRRPAKVVQWLSRPWPFSLPLGVIFVPPDLKPESVSRYAA